MADDLVIMDTDMSIGFIGGPSFNTSVVTFGGGIERRNQAWTRPRFQYQFDYSGRSAAEIEALNDFFIGRRGMARSWLLYDWMDHSLSVEAQGVGDGTSPGQFTLIKTYDDAVNPWVRTIEYIDEAALTVFLDGVPTAHDSFSLGTVLMPAPIGVGVAITVTLATFYVPVRFSTDEFMATVLTPAATHADVQGLGALEVLS